MSVVSLQGQQYNDGFSPAHCKKDFKVSVIQAPQAMTPRRAAEYTLIEGIMLPCLWSNKVVS